MLSKLPLKIPISHSCDCLVFLTLKENTIKYDVWKCDDSFIISPLFNSMRAMQQIKILFNDVDIMLYF